MAGLQMKYFVLNPTKDDAYGEASRQALRAYAETIHSVNPALTEDLSEWLQDITDNLRTTTIKRSGE